MNDYIKTFLINQFNISQSQRIREGIESIDECLTHVCYMIKDVLYYYKRYDNIKFMNIIAMVGDKWICQYYKVNNIMHRFVFIGGKHEM